MSQNARVLTRAVNNLSSGAILNPEQATAFIDILFNAATTLAVCKRTTMRAPKKNVDFLSVPSRLLRKGARRTAPTATTALQNSQVQLEAKLLRAAIYLPYEDTRDTIERGRYEQHAVNLCGARIGTDMNDQAWNGDTTDYSAAATTLTIDHNNSVATITVASTASFPTASDGYGFLVIESERIEYTGKTANTFTGATRGADNTTAAAHSNGTAVTFIQDALYPTYDGIRKQIIADSSQLVDGSAIGDGSIEFLHFNALMDVVPARDRNSALYKPAYRWWCNDAMFRGWLHKLQLRATDLGDRSITADQLQGKVGPGGFPFHLDEHIRDGDLLLGPATGIHHGVREDNIRVAVVDNDVTTVSTSTKYLQWDVEADTKVEQTGQWGIATGILTTPPA